MTPILHLSVSPKMHPNFFLLCSTSLMIIIAHVPSAWCQNNDQYVICSRLLQCANMSNIGYPFWGGSRPAYCGHPGYDLNCDGEAPEFRMMGMGYRVVDINNPSNTLTVARVDYWNSTCPNEYLNTTLNHTLFSYNTTYPSLTLYYGCPASNLSTSSQFSCNSTSGGRVVAYYVTRDLSSTAINSICSDNVIIPIFQSAATALESNTGSTSLLRKALNGGFGLKWDANNSLCHRCVSSGGQCGYNSTSNSFTCYCPDMPHASTCQRATGSSRNVRIKIFAGISAGLGGITIVFAMIYGLRRKCLPGTTVGFLKKESKEDHNMEEFIKSHGSLAPKRYSFSDVKKMTNSFSYKLGQGGFGCVYKGKLFDGRLVAVKVLSELKATGDEFMNEVASISRTSHVNMVMLVGFCYDGVKRALIYEFMPNGSLDKFISDTGSSDTNLHLEWKTLYQIAVGISRGLEYLHRGCHTRILHFDIKPHNILLDENFCPKISDFGLAKLCQKTESIISITGARGTAGYIAPEVFCRNFGGVSHKSDVYSYGMLVLEMVGGIKNREVARSSDIYFPDWIYKHLEQGEDLILGRAMTQEEEETVRKMILVSLWCIQTNPLDRPSISKVVEMLEGSLQPLETPPKPFLFSPA